MSSGSATTTNATDLDLRWGSVDQQRPSTPVGRGSPDGSTSYGNRTQDKRVTATGAYTATATQNSSSLGHAHGRLQGRSRGVRRHHSAVGSDRPDGHRRRRRPRSTSRGTRLRTTSPSPDTGSSATAPRSERRAPPCIQDTGLTAEPRRTATPSAAVRQGRQHVGSIRPVPAPRPRLLRRTRRRRASSLTAPTAGATVKRQRRGLTANASDDVGVLGVQFLMDGVNAGRRGHVGALLHHVGHDHCCRNGIAYRGSAGAGCSRQLTTTSTPVHASLSTTRRAQPGLAGRVCVRRRCRAGRSPMLPGTGSTARWTNGATLGRRSVRQRPSTLDGGNDNVDLGNPASLQFTGSMTLGACGSTPSAFPGDDGRDHLQTRASATRLPAGHDRRRRPRASSASS